MEILGVQVEKFGLENLPTIGNGFHPTCSTRGINIFLRSKKILSNVWSLKYLTFLARGWFIINSSSKS